jgi:hypothetical protein
MEPAKAVGGDREREPTCRCWLVAPIGEELRDASAVAREVEPHVARAVAQVVDGDDLAGVPLAAMGEHGLVARLDGYRHATADPCPAPRRDRALRPVQQRLLVALLMPDVRVASR